MVSVQVKHFDHKTGVSQRKADRKFGISVGYINKLLKSDQLGCNVKCRKKIKIPDRSEVQKLMAKKTNNPDSNKRKNEIVSCVHDCFSSVKTGGPINEMTHAAMRETRPMPIPTTALP